ncbi:pilus assembly protein [Shewanella donghaensis]|uniref:pilus assembly protein n=1 Tax=Shewanella donghaensis TaxID=238836 RepID=UPI0011835B7B|nr:pilus assembly protein [Shewanella donghaensis]
MTNKILGQGMTEYIIIVALMAVSSIGVYSFFGQTIRNQIAGLAREMSGQDSSLQITAAQGSAAQASIVGSRQYNLGTYNEGANGATGGTGTGGDTGGGGIVD